MSINMSTSISTLHIEFNDLVKLLNCEPKAIESFSKHLTDDELTVMAAAADKAPKEVLKQLFKKTFFNTDHPENVTFTVLDPELTKGTCSGETSGTPATWPRT